MSFSARMLTATDKATALHEKDVEGYSWLSSEQKEHWENMNTVPCRKYFESDSYNSGETDTIGYKYCCDMHGWCGMSGWMIFLIVVICLGVLAAAGAALWFFYLKRKFGGKEEEVKEEEEGKTESKTENSGSEVIEINGTY